MTTIVTSRAGVVTDALIAALKASSVFADPVEVFDGPQTIAGTTYTQCVFVGFDGDWRTDGRGQVATHTEYAGVKVSQRRPYIGNTTVEENLDVPCCVEAWGGDPTAKTVRDQCLAMLAGVETVIRTDPTLAVDGTTNATLTVGDMAYEFDDSGNLNCHVPFTVNVVTTIPTNP